MPATGCAYTFLVSVVLVVLQPVGIHVLNQLTSCRIWFNSHSCVLLPGKTTSFFNHFKLPCQSKSLKQTHVINLIKISHIKLFGKNISTETFLCIVRSVQSTQHVKCSARFRGLFCFHGGIYDMSKGKVIGSTLKI